MMEVGKLNTYFLPFLNSSIKHANPNNGMFGLDKPCGLAYNKSALTLQVEIKEPCEVANSLIINSGNKDLEFACLIQNCHTLPIRIEVSLFFNFNMLLGSKKLKLPP